MVSFNRSIPRAAAALVLSAMSEVVPDTGPERPTCPAIRTTCR